MVYANLFLWNYLKILLLIKVFVKEGCIFVLQTLYLYMVLDLKHISAEQHHR